MSSPWEIIGRTTGLHTARLRASIDLSDPAAGVRIESVDGDATDGIVVFGIAIDRLGAADDSSALECFARGSDLVARYAETSARPFRVEVYWRAVEFGDRETSGSISGIDLILSLQTSRLEIDTDLTVRTTLSGAAECIRFDEIAKQPRQATGADYFHFRLAQPTLSYMEMVHPADVRQTRRLLETPTPTTIGQTGLMHRLFVQRLEKGVILRSRIRGLFLPREQDSALAKAEYQRFALSEPPLTA